MVTICFESAGNKINPIGFGQVREFAPPQRENRVFKSRISHLCVISMLFLIKNKPPTKKRDVENMMYKSPFLSKKKGILNNYVNLTESNHSNYSPDCTYTEKVENAL